MKSNYRILAIIGTALVAGCMLMTGCQIMDGAAGDINAQISENDIGKQTAYGSWYDDDSDTYFELKDNNTYIMGHGKYNETAGGSAYINDKTITLKAEYVIVDDVKQNVTMGQEMLWTYNLNGADTLKITANGFEMKLKRIHSTSLEKINLTGEWINKTDNTTLCFDATTYTKIKSDGSSTQGTFHLTGDKLILSRDNTDLTYDIAAQNENGFSLNLDGMQTVYERMK